MAPPSPNTTGGHLWEIAPVPILQLLRAPWVNSAAGRCNSVAYLQRAWECRLHWTGHVPNNPDLNGVDTPLGLCRSKSTMVGSLTPWTTEAGDRAGVTRTVTALYWSQHWIMETSFAVCRGIKWRSQLHVPLAVCTVKLLLSQTWCWNIFWSRAYSTTSIVNYQPGSNVLIHTSYAFIKIKLASCHLLLYVVYIYQKLLNFIDAFSCYKKNMKVGPV